MRTISAPIPVDLEPGDTGHVLAHENIRAWMQEVGGVIPQTAADVGAADSAALGNLSSTVTANGNTLATALASGGAISNAVATATAAANTASAAQGAAAAATTAATNATNATASKLATATALLLAAATPDAMAVGAIGRDANAAATTFAVVWPDTATGTFTTVTASTAFPGAVDGYTVTHVLAGVTTTYTQPTLTRDPTSGAVTARPAITVA